MKFLGMLCDVELYTYQREVAERVFFSLLIEDNEEVTILSARQSGKSEALACTCATALVILPILAKLYPEDPVLSKYKSGVYIGVFGPIDFMSENLFSRIRLRLSTEKAKKVLSSPDIDDEVFGTTTIMHLRKSQSFCRKQTAHPQAKVESSTYHLVVVDEAQDADATTVRKSIHPMLVATAGTIVKTGTSTSHISDFYEAINRNKRRKLTNGQKNHLEFDWHRAAKENKRYAKSIEREKVRLGEDSDEFNMCVAPDTRVLTADLRHIPASQVTKGMKLVGFDEHRPGYGLHRKLKETVVEAVSTIERPSYRLDMDDGTSITCSAEHLWLVTTAGRRTIWKTTEGLVESDRIFKITDVWDSEDSYEEGYLAAAFDGEGCLWVPSEGTSWQLQFSQKENIMLSKVRSALTSQGFTWWETEDHGCKVLHIAGGRAAIMHFLGKIRPQRLLDKFEVDRLGSIGRHDHKNQDFRHPTIEKKVFLGTQEVVAFRTSTRTFVAEGLASHNSFNLRWLLDRGMFLTESQAARLGDRTMERIPYYFDSPVVMGLDVARKHDSTVATALFVDWEHPDEFGLYHHVVLDWLELHGEDWEGQYAQICDFAGRWSVSRMGVDAQGMGEPVAERLDVLLPNVDVVPLPMNPIDQSERWRHLLQLLQREKVRWPAGEQTRRTKPFQRFVQQMTEVEKEYKGKYIVVEANPRDKNAHDDYVDSLALAAWMTKDFGQSRDVVEWNHNPLLERGTGRHALR
jgi:hypothetical protein